MSEIMEELGVAPVTETPPPAPAVELIPPVALPLTPTESVTALSVEVAKTLHDVFLYIHEGFNENSLMIGLSRFYEIARAVKAKAEA